jgi:hypothetical protein
LGGIIGEEVLEEKVRFLALASGGFKEAAHDGVILESFGSAGALDDPAHNDHGAEGALGVVVGGRDVGTAKAGEEEFLFGAQQAFAKGFGLGVAERRAA